MTELDPTNKIAQGNSVKKPPARSGLPPLKPEKAPATSDRVTLSNKPQQVPLETSSTKAPAQIREKLVGQFREILEQGTYKIKADEIAKKMVQKIREQKDQTII